MEYSIVNHTADLGVWIKASTLEQLFEDAGKILMEISLGESFIFEENYEIKEFEIEGSDLVDLMVRWLGELLYILDGERFIFCRTKDIQITDGKFHAWAYFVPFKEELHNIETYIKAVTYHQAKVEKKDAWWEAFLIFDV